MKLTSCEVDFSLKGSERLQNRMKEYRATYKITQKELSEKVNVTSRTIISLENGKFNPSIMLAYRIACVFNTTVEDVFCLQENKEWEDLNHE